MDITDLVGKCQTKSPIFEACGEVFEKRGKRRSTLCPECKVKYGVALRKKNKDDAASNCRTLLLGLPERSVLKPGITRIPVTILQPAQGEDYILLRGRYSRHGNMVEVRPFPVEKDQVNAATLAWYDIETGTKRKELLVTGLWLEPAEGRFTSFFSGRLGESKRELRLEIHRQGDVFVAYYAQG